MQPITLNLLEENVAENVCVFRLCKDFLDNTKNTIHKRKNHEWDFTQIKNIYSSKDIVRRMKTSRDCGQKTSKSCSWKSIVSRIYLKNSWNSIIRQKKKTTTIKMVKTWIDILPKSRHWGQRKTKRCSASWHHQGNARKTAARQRSGYSWQRL